jgi:endonuclease/exonuclease/phosphatase family metal-dependent hydrolase
VHDQLIPYLTASETDVVCLQEMVHTPEAEAEWLIYRDHGVELPQRARLYREVSAALPDHQGFFCPAACGDLYDDERAVRSEWGLATFIRRSLPVIGQVQDFVHGGFSADGWGDHPRARNAHGVRLFDYEGGFAITIVHMHGLRDLAGKEDTPARLAQAKALADVIGRLRRNGERLVVCGDFNVLPASKTFDILGGLGLTELVTTRGFTDTRTSFYTKPGRYADYMLVSPEVEVRRFDVVKSPEVSDHRALVLDLA